MKRNALQNIDTNARTAKRRGGKTNQKTPSEKEDTSVFLKILTSSGMSLSNGIWNVLHGDEIAVKTAIAKNIDRVSREPFVQELKSFLEENIENLKNALEPITGTGESLLRLLLQIPGIQVQVAKFVLETAIEKACYDDSSTTNICIRLLEQFQFLNIIEDGEALAAAAFECLECLESISTHADLLKRKFFELMPHILEDSQHPRAVELFMKMLKTHTSMTSPIIQCVSNLRVSTEDIEKLRDSVLQVLNSAPFEDLTIALRYLISTLDVDITRDALRNLVQNIRTCLVRISLDDIAGDMDSGKETTLLQIVDLLQISFAGNTTLRKVYFDIIVASVDLCVLDFWILIAMQNCPRCVVEVQEVVLKCIKKCTTIDEMLVRKSIQGHSFLLRNLFPQYLKLAGSLVRGGSTMKRFGSSNASPQSRTVGQVIYEALFLEINEPCPRQEIIYALTMHGNAESNSDEAYAALDLLCRLVDSRESVERMEPYIELVKYLVQNINHETSQDFIRKLFFVLSHLVVLRSDPDPAGVSWYFILLQKLIANPYRHQRFAGVIGTIQYLVAISSGDAEDDDSWNELIGHAMRSGRSNAQAMSMLCSELLQVMPQLNDQIMEYFSDELGAEFTTKFMLFNENLEECTTLGDHYRVSIQYEFQELRESLCSVNLGDFLARNVMNTRYLERFQYLCPVTKCLLISDMRHGRWDVPETIFSSGLILPDPATVQKMIQTPLLFDTRTQSTILRSYFFAVTWFREIVNIISLDPQLQDNEPLQAALFDRLHALENCETILETLIDRATDSTLCELTEILNTDSSKWSSTGIKPKTSSSSSSSKTPKTSLQKSIRNVYPALEIHTVAIVMLPGASSNKFAVRTVLQSLATRMQATRRQSFSQEDVQAILDIIPNLLKIIGDVSQAGEADENIIIAACGILKGAFETVRQGASSLDLESLINACMDGITQEASDIEPTVRVFDFIGINIVNARPMTQPDLLEILDAMSSIDETSIKVNVSHFRSCISQRAQSILNSRSVNEPLANNTLKRLMYLYLHNTADPISETLQLIMDIEHMVQDHAPCQFFPLITRKNLPNLFDLLMKEIQYQLDHDISIPKKKIARVGSSNGKAAKSSSNLVVNEADDEATQEERANDEEEDEPCSGPEENTMEDGCGEGEGEGAGEDEPDEAISDNNPRVTLELIEKVCKMGYILVNLTRHMDDSKKLIHGAIRYGTVFVERFCKYCLPYMEAHLKEYEEQIGKSIQEINQMMRQLHAICDHGKATKDSTILAFVPRERKINEMLALKAREICNKSSGTHLKYTIGTLKSRNINGSSSSNSNKITNH